MTPRLPGRPALADEDVRLLDEAAAWIRAHRTRLADLTPDALAELARTRNLDFATAVFHEAAAADEAHAAFLAAVAAASRSSLQRPDLIAIVPGAFHRESRDTGADGARVIGIARELGCAAEVIPVPGFGRVEDNARLICDWLQRRPERDLAIVSLSKGGPDVKSALGRAEAARAFARVRGWISFSGIVQGTPLIAWLRARPLRWWSVHLLLWLRRHPRATLADLRHDAHGPRASWPPLPPHLRIVHICGVPLRRHLQHRWAPRAYERLRPLGPNDGGGVLLGSLANIPGTVYPVWGADHYLQPSWNATPLLRDIVVTALSSVERRQAIPSANSPSPAPAMRSTT